LLLALYAQNSKEERLSLVISFINKEQLIAVPKLNSYTGNVQAQALWNAVIDWNLEDNLLVVITFMSWS